MTQRACSAYILESTKKILEILFKILERCKRRFLYRRKECYRFYCKAY